MPAAPIAPYSVAVNAVQDPLAARPPRLSETWRYWLRLGFVSFGGPAGQIATMHADLVERHRWLSERRFLHALNYCMVLPGPEAQQLATYIGWLMHRTAGGIVAGALFVLPSLAILVALSWAYLRFGQVPAVAGVLYGVRPAVVAVVLAAAWRIGSRTLRQRLAWSIALAAFVAIAAFGVPFPVIMVAAGLVGLAGARFAPDGLQAPAGAGHGAAAGRAPERALIDDDTPTPPHARWSAARAARVAAVCALAWGSVFGALVALHGWDGTLTRMGWFFTKAALLTFGGAYAVLPYVLQGAVEQYGWISAAQMLDGLALGETTPGPLIRVVAFVGFVGGWNAEVAGLGAPFVSGALAASVVTFFTFLPSCLFILLGAPLIESSRGQLGWAAPLAGIAAAVVGVIVDLALFLARHVVWPQGLGGPVDWVAALLAGLALVALVRFKAGVVPVLAAGAAAGLLAAWLR